MESAAPNLLYNDFTEGYPLGNSPGTCNSLIVATRLPSNGLFARSIIGDAGSEAREVESPVFGRVL